MTLFKSLRVRAAQGTQYIPDLRRAVPSGFRGLPVLGAEPCASECDECRQACPTGAIGVSPLRLDLGRCVFCQACVETCPNTAIHFTDEPKMAASRREDLVITRGSVEVTRIRASEAFSKVFGRSLKMRQVSAGGCNACELELNAVMNVNFDAQRFGIEWVASPRHADALVVTGPLTRSMKNAVQLAWEAMPDPRFVVAVGACAISGGLYEGATGVDRTFLESVGPSLFVPGCPPHPLTFINAVLDFLGIA